MTERVVRVGEIELVCADFSTGGLAGDKDELARLLNAAVANSWPPELLKAYFEEGHGIHDAITESGWGIWWIVSLVDGMRTLVGHVSFDGPPEDGGVAVWCEVQPSHRRMGIASTSVRVLAEHVFENAEVGFVEAYARAGDTAAVKTAKRAGFVADGTDEDGNLRFSMTRSDLQGVRARVPSSYPGHPPKNMVTRATLSGRVVSELSAGRRLPRGP